jgi:hypothetical protein
MIKFSNTYKNLILKNKILSYNINIKKNICIIGGTIESLTSAFILKKSNKFFVDLIIDDTKEFIEKEVN